MAVLKYSNTFLRRSLALSFSSISLKTLQRPAAEVGACSSSSNKKSGGKDPAEATRNAQGNANNKRTVYSTPRNGWADRSHA